MDKRKEKKPKRLKFFLKKGPTMTLLLFPLTCNSDFLALQQWWQQNPTVSTPSHVRLKFAVSAFIPIPVSCCVDMGMLAKEKGPSITG